MLRRKRLAQTTAEYAIVIALVIGAVIAMQVYVRRGLQGRIKDAVDYRESGDANFTFNTSQYEPDYLKSDASTDRDVTESQQLSEGGQFYRGIEGEEKTISKRAQTFEYNETE